MMSLMITLKVSLAGAVVGCLGAAGIYWEPQEPYKHWILAAGTLNGVVNALLATVFINGKTSIAAAMGAGAACGLTTAVVVFLAKGGWQSGDAPYVIPTGLIEGLLVGLAVRWLLS